MKTSMVITLGLYLAAASLSEAKAAPPEPGPATRGDTRAQLIALQSSILSAELNARIATLPWREGQAVKAGQPLITFDCRSYQAQLAQAKAQEKEAHAAVDVLRRLSSLQATSELEELQAQARLEQAQAEVGLREVQTGHCEIRAPFSGRIGEVYHQAHEVVSTGEKLLALINDRDLEIEMIVPSSYLPQLPKGTRFTLVLDEVPAPLAAEVTRSSGVIDPVSQTIKVFGRLIKPATGLMPGMSGKASFETE